MYYMFPHSARTPGACTAYDQRLVCRSRWSVESWKIQC